MEQKEWGIFVRQLAVGLDATEMACASIQSQILGMRLTLRLLVEETGESAALLPDERLLTLLRKSVDELEISVRSYNCLKNASIKTIGELVQKDMPEMLKSRNFGRHSIKEIEAILGGMGLSLGMELSPEILRALKEKVSEASPQP